MLILFLWETRAYCHLTPQIANSIPTKSNLLLLCVARRGQLSIHHISKKNPLTTIIYRIFLELYYYTALILAFFLPKADMWLAGQRQTWLHLQKTAANSHRPTIWIHCASLGEFEQARPIIETVKAQYPNTRLILTFFSPSGYEIRKNYALADEICYLPLDTPTNVQLWLTQKKPTIAIFVKYEFWHYYLQALQQNNVPTYLIAAIFRPEQVFFKWYGGFFRQMLHRFSHIFVQNPASVALLQKLRINSTVAGDTRFDRVVAKSQQPEPLPLIRVFKADYHLMVAGSTWSQDEIALAQVINQTTDQQLQHIRWIIVPHEPNDNHNATLEKLLTVEHIRYSEANEKNIRNVKVLIIDSIGMLADLYQYAEYAYIGGGFGKGIHNTLEAAVFGMPIFFGPKYDKFQEAKDLIDRKAAFAIQNANELHSLLLKMELKPIARQQSAAASQQYVLQNQGATLKIMQDIAQHFRP